jgi:hypothetical protein
MPAERSGSAVVLPINTKRLGGYFKFLINGKFSQKNAISDKILLLLFCLATVPKFLPKKSLLLAPCLDRRYR